MKACGENIAPRILILGTEWDKWSVVHPVRLISFIPCIGGWVGPVFGLPYQEWTTKFSIVQSVTY